MSHTLFRGVRGLQKIGNKFKKRGKKDSDSLSTGGYPKMEFQGNVSAMNDEEADSEEDEELLYDEVT